MFASHNISARSAFIVAVLILVSPNLHAFEPDPRAPGI